MTTLIKNVLRKTEVPKLLRMYGTSGRLRFECELAGRRDEVKTRVSISLDNVKIVRSYSLHFGVSSESGSYTRHEPVKMKHVNKYIRTTRKYRKKIQGLRLLSLSPHDMFFSLFSELSRLSFYILFLSPEDDLRSVVAVANKLLC